MTFLSDARRDLGLTQQQIADQLGLSLRAYQEQEASEEPRLAYVLATEGLLHRQGDVARRPSRNDPAPKRDVGRPEFPARPRQELQELVDEPNETLSAEYKSWVDFQNEVARAKIARHIAALANHGGGYLVFGFNDDLSIAPAPAEPSYAVSRDVIAAIVKKYLEPAFQCDVLTLRSRAGGVHPIVIVPPHGPTPVCTKSGGPEEKQKPQGVVRGVYYVRKPGPASEPASSPADWQAIIRRCSLHDTASLVNAITALGAPTLAHAAGPAPLDLWHEAANAEFLRRVEADPTRAWLKTHRWQLSYQILTGGERLGSRSFEQIVAQANHEVRDFVQTGWSMFHPFTRDPIYPRWENDPASGEEDDFLQCSLVDEETTVGGVDFWRMSPSGKATLVRDYWEDEQREGSPIARGTLFDPYIAARSLAELVRHARAFAERFPDADRVAFKIEWWGLNGRHPGSVERNSRPYGRVGRSDHRLSQGVWTVGELASQWAEIVAALGGPVGRIFGIEERFEPDYLRRQSDRWARL